MAEPVAQESVDDCAETSPPHIPSLAPTAIRIAMEAMVST